MQSANHQRGNALLLVLCVILVLGAAGFMFYGYQRRSQPARPAIAPGAEVRGTRIDDPVVPATNQLAALPATGPGGATNAAATPKAFNLEKVKLGDGQEYLAVGFDALASFEYVIPEEAGTNAVAKVEPPKDQIPPPVRALNQQRIALKGFMLPLKVEGGLITELLIMRDQSMCCYGAVPKINEWVSVRMTSKGVKPIMDQAVTLYGTLKVGEIRENGYLVGIYEMDGERMAGPLDL